MIAIGEVIALYAARCGAAHVHAERYGELLLAASMGPLAPLSCCNPDLYERR